MLVPIIEDLIVLKFGVENELQTKEYIYLFLFFFGEIQEKSLFIAF